MGPSVHNRLIRLRISCAIVLETSFGVVGLDGGSSVIRDPLAVRPPRLQVVSLVPLHKLGRWV